VICALFLVPFLLSSQDLSLLPPFPSTAALSCSEQPALSAHLLQDGLSLPVAFSNTTDRVYWDIPLPTRIPTHATALEIDLSCSEPTLLRGFSFHLKSGNGWHSFSRPVTAALRQRLSLPRASFQKEDNPGAWEKSRTLRISAWRNVAASGSTVLLLRSVHARTDSVAIVQATDFTAPGESAFARSLSDRCERLLAKAGVPYAVIDDRCDTLSDFKLILQPYSPVLPDSQLKRLVRYVEHGGKLIVFYSASQPLANLLGVRVGTWQGSEANAEWSALVCDTAALPHAPARIPHFTSNLLPPFPTTSHHARTVASWADEGGRITDQPACVLTDRGAWFAHVPPLASTPAADFLRILACTLYPELQQTTALALLRDTPVGIDSADALVQSTRLKIEAAVKAQTFQEIPSLCRDLRNAAAAAALVAQPSQPNEIRSAWEPRSSGRSPQGWDMLMRTLAQSGINTLFVHWQSAGTAFYRTGGKRVEAPIVLRRTNDSFAAAAAAAKRSGIAHHAWVTCWTLEGCAESQRTQLEKEDRLMRDASGKALPWLCPSIAANRTLIIEGLRDLAKRGVQGIHLDYVRYPDTQGCYASATRKAFESQRGAAVAHWPADVLPEGPQAAEFQKFKSATMTAFVREAHDALRAINPEIQLSAAVFPSPEAAARQSQDWPAWVKEGYVAFVCPMIYTENDSNFSASLEACCAAVPTPANTIVAGIGTGADESQLDAFGTACQILKSRSRHTAGFAFFAIDDGLLTQVLPNLALRNGPAHP